MKGKVLCVVQDRSVRVKFSLDFGAKEDRRRKRKPYQMGIMHTNLHHQNIRIVRTKASFTVHPLSSSATNSMQTKFRQSYINCDHI